MSLKHIKLRAYNQFTCANVTVIGVWWLALVSYTLSNMSLWTRFLCFILFLFLPFLGNCKCAFDLVWHYKFVSVYLKFIHESNNHTQNPSRPMRSTNETTDTEIKLMSSNLSKYAVHIVQYSQWVSHSNRMTTSIYVGQALKRIERRKNWILLFCVCVCFEYHFNAECI